jgi:uncharacterized OsmC-like protein
MKRTLWLVIATIFALGILSACTIQPVQPPPPPPEFATARAFAQNSNQFGRTIVSARGNHFIIDSAPPLGHPAEEINPVEAMLAALATCGIFVYETAAQEQEIPLNSASAVVQADWDVRGLRGEDFNPQMQAIRVHLNVDGPDAAQLEALEAEFTSRCPMYTTFIKAADIAITTNDEAMGGPSAEGLATSAITGTLTNQPGRAIVQARNNYLVVDSVPPLGSPSEEVNPLDLFLGAQGSCGNFIMERVALDNNIPLTNVAATIEADLDPRGVRGLDFDPAIKEMRVHWFLSGVDEAQAETLVNSWLERCPIYNTLIEAAPIEVSHEIVEGAIAMPD